MKKKRFSQIKKIKMFSLKEEILPDKKDFKKFS